MELQLYSSLKAACVKNLEALLLLMWHYDNLYYTFKEVHNLCFHSPPHEMQA